MLPLYPTHKLIAVLNEEAREVVAMGVDIGHPDLYLISQNGIFYLELKRKKGKLSTAQKAWNKWFDDNLSGAEWASRDVAYGFIEAKEKIIKRMAVANKPKRN